MSEKQALSLCKWLSDHLGEGYDVDVVRNYNNQYRVVISNVDNEFNPSIIIYDALNLDEEVEEWAKKEASST